MEKCPVCGRDDVKNLRKHATGKWLNDSTDYRHMLLAIKLTPGAQVYLRNNLREVKNGTTVEERRWKDDWDDRPERVGGEVKSELEQLLGI